VSPRPTPFLIPLFLAAAACGRDSPVEPAVASTQPLETEPAAAVAAQRVVEPLAIQDMLDDPLFRALVAEITESSLGGPLAAGVNALAAGDLRAGSALIQKAGAAAEALSRRKDADANSLMLWSAVERYLEAAKLL
jgi:hypothetical protein